MQIERRGRVQRRRYVYLEQPRLQLRVEQHVDAKQLEAIVPAAHVRFGHVIDGTLASENGAQHEIAQSAPQTGGVDALRGQVGPQRFDGPFVALARVGVFVFGVVGRKLVDAVVGEVHVAIVERVGFFTVFD